MLDEAEVARKMPMWAREGLLQATRAEATRASGAVVAAPGNANIGDILGTSAACGGCCATR